MCKLGCTGYLLGNALAFVTGKKLKKAIIAPLIAATVTGIFVSAGFSLAGPTLGLAPGLMAIAGAYVAIKLTGKLMDKGVDRFLEWKSLRPVLFSARSWFPFNLNINL